jgi:outer membrane receptor protein involved in Fe transport
LPFEDAILADKVPPRIPEQVNLETGRVRPASTFDVSGGWTLLKTATSRIELQADVRNVANTLRVINFAGVFSGTALAPPRAFGARVRVEF